MSVNSVTLLGYLGNEPKVGKSQRGDTICSFSVATSDKWKDKVSGESKEKTEWHFCQAYGKVGEICAKYLAKGSRIYLEGSLNTRQYKDKTGAEKQLTAIIVREVELLSPPKKVEPTALDKAIDNIPGVTQAKIDPFEVCGDVRYTEELPF